jgi:probable H4MPT-linked C1 transfer pathway protein
MRDEPVIGWDLGGAHLKAARLNRSGAVEGVLQLPCPLWQGLPHLQLALAQAEASLGTAPRHGVTMTGEMVDLFADRGEGVARLVGLMRERCPEAALRFYAGREGFVDAEQALAAAPRVASANWMASATMVAAQMADALFLDIGSTTTDLTVVRHGQVAARGHGDGARLVAGELVYTGVVRTPLMAVAPRVPFAGDWVPQMAEYFATTADVYRLIGRLPDGADQHPAADGGEKTERGSARRLARMIGRDAESMPIDAWRRLAAWLAREQSRRIEDACERLITREDLPDAVPVVGAGVGRFLAAELAARLGRPYLEFARLVPATHAEGGVSDCAPAVAVAWLAQREAA